MNKQVKNKNTTSYEQSKYAWNSASLLSEQKIREFVAKPEQSEHKSNTKKLC